MPVQILNRATRDRIYAEILAIVQAESPNLAMRCLDFAWAGYQILKTWPGAPRTIIQAGSAQWPRILPEQDDGVCDTHFSYVWEPDSLPVRIIAADKVPMTQMADGKFLPTLPSMHVWLACPGTGEIIDFSTGQWPEACLATAGLSWPGLRPPAYFWDFGTRLPEWVNYAADRSAIDFVCFLLRKMGKTYP